MKASDVVLLGQIVVFGAILPTVDTFSDLFLSGKLFQAGQPLWALAILLPVLINFFFIAVAFRQFPFPPWHHRYVSWTMLVFQVKLIMMTTTLKIFHQILSFSLNFLPQVWPQYLSLSTAHGFLVDNPEWVKRRAYYMRNISTFEPFVESIAQLIIKLCIWTFYLQDHLEKFQGKVNPLFEDSSPPPFFYVESLVQPCHLRLFPRGLVILNLICCLGQLK